MSQYSQFTILPGSSRPAHFGNHIRIVDNIQDIDISVQVRRRQDLNACALTKTCYFLSRQQLEETYGASPKDISVVLAFAENFGLEVTDIDAGKRLISLRGSANIMAEAFKVQIFETHSQGKVGRSRVGPIFIPLELVNIVTGVFGLDNRPQAISHLRFKDAQIHLQKPNAFDGNQLAQIYDFPVSDGKGQTIALIELGGGFLNTDIGKYFAALNLPHPTVHSVSVNGGRNNPFIDNGADTEVTLDIEVAAAVAPGANIVVYFAPNDDQSFLKAILAAVHDEINKPNVISISWGAAENSWTEQQMLAMSEAFQSAAALGISVFCAAGDDGANDNVYDGKVHVDFPASSPFAIACGGTSLVVTSVSRTESVWNDGDGSATGGGISSYFARPDYQKNTALPKNLAIDFDGRGLPDVSAVADPATGYAVLVHGHWITVGGTSAVAPLYAGLAARMNALLPKPAGLINQTIYSSPSAGLFNDITNGDNSVDRVVGYESSSGWDAVTGFGSPIGKMLLSLFANRPSSSSLNT